MIVRTSEKKGSPGYLDNNAPKGLQWIVAGVHAKVPEGTQVEIVGSVNGDNFVLVRILSGIHAGKEVWIKRTHVVDDTAVVVYDFEAIGKALVTLLSTIAKVFKS